MRNPVRIGLGNMAILRSLRRGATRTITRKDSHNRSKVNSWKFTTQV